jgi:kynureninase
METLKSKRFVIRKSLLGQGVLVEFQNKKGDQITYDHDKAYEVMKETLDNLPCFEKYKSYTATNNIPKAIRDTEAVIENVLAEVKETVEEVEEILEELAVN